MQNSQPIIKPSVLLHLGSPEMPAMLPGAFMNELPKADPDTHALHEAYHVAEVCLCVFSSVSCVCGCGCVLVCGCVWVWVCVCVCVCVCVLCMSDGCEGMGSRVSMSFRL
jgi:hypothetical protein